jgi:hypothetical protein
VAKTLKHGLDFYVPLLLVVAVGVGASSFFLIWWREGGQAGRARAARGPALLGGLLVTGGGALAYLVSRTDAFHAQPLFVLMCVALAIVVPRSPLPVAGVCVLVLGLLLAHGVANRLSALVRPPSESRIHLAVADGVRAPPPEARAIEQMVGLVRARVPPGKPIYVAPRRSDLVRFNDPLVYVLAERENPTHEDFGLLTGAAAQRRIVDVLRRARPRAIVRWTDPISSQREPNLRGRSSGVYTVDRWIASHYHLLARLYHYDVLIPR